MLVPCEKFLLFLRWLVLLDGVLRSHFGYGSLGLLLVAEGAGGGARVTEVGEGLLVLYEGAVGGPHVQTCLTSRALKGLV